MKKSVNIFLGWGLVGAVVLATIFGLPKLAGATSALKDADRWQARATRLQRVDTEYASTSNLAKTLAERHLSPMAGNVYWQDAQRTRDLVRKTNLVAPARDTSRQMNCLAEAIYYEARSESIDGQKAVGEVILNRVKHKAFPNTICEVVYQGAERTTGCQFSFTCDGSTAKLPRGRHWQEAQKIAAHMMLGASAPLTNRATHYHTVSVNPKWSSTLRELRQYDTHIFYRFMPRRKMLPPISVAP